jgi:hypothetical protein
MLTRSRLLLFGVVLTAAVVSGVIVAGSKGDLGNWLVSVAVLVIGALTLHIVAPTPGRLVVERQHELELSDLIFYVYPQPASFDDTQVPQDYLLQLHVAVTNVGGRKAVLSRLRLNRFVTRSGQRIHLPEGVHGSLQAHKWVQGRFAPNLYVGPAVPTAQQVGPPFTLEPDEVETLRFRMRRGVDWSQRWTLERLRDYAEQLTDPIVAVEGDITYRRGAKVVTDSWSVDLVVAQQELYVELFSKLTAGFTKLPDLPPVELPLE